MRTALWRRNIVDKAVAAFRITVVMLHRYFYINFFFHALAIDDAVIKSFLIVVEIGDIFLDPSLIMEFLCHNFLFPSVV